MLPFTHLPPATENVLKWQNYILRSLRCCDSTVSRFLWTSLHCSVLSQLLVSWGVDPPIIAFSSTERAWRWGAFSSPLSNIATKQLTPSRPGWQLGSLKLNRVVSWGRSMRNCQVQSFFSWCQRWILIKKKSQAWWYLFPGMCLLLNAFKEQKRSTARNYQVHSLKCHGKHSVYFQPQKVKEFKFRENPNFKTTGQNLHS